MKKHTSSILITLCALALAIFWLPSQTMAAQAKLIGSTPLTEPLTDADVTMTEEEFRQLDLVGISGGLDASTAASSVEESGLFRDSLTGYARTIYDELAKADVGNSAYGVTVTFQVANQTERDELQKVISKVYSQALWAYQRDHMDQFHWSTNQVSMSRGGSGNTVYYRVGYPYSEFYTDAIGAQADSVIAGVVSKCAATTRIDKVRYYHDWIIQNCEYDFDALTITEMQNEEHMYYAHTAMGCLIKGTGVCETYAKTFKIFCIKEQIPCVIVTSEGHAYNYVKMDDGSWYLVDCTWDDQTYTDFQHKYYLISNRPYLDEDHTDDKTQVYPKTSLGDYGDTCRWVITQEKDATCLEDGVMTVKCQDCNKTRSTTIVATGHEYGDTVYDWASDYTTCTLSAECEKCGRTESETVSVTKTVQSEATCGRSGYATVKLSTVFKLQISTSLVQNRTINKTQSVTIPATGLHNYVDGTCTGCGAIRRVDTDASISLSYTSCTYSGKLKKPTVTVVLNSDSTPLVKDVDYKLEYDNNRDAGKASVLITGINSVGGSVRKYYTIKPKTLTTSMAKLAFTSTTYTGNYKKPTVTVTDGDKVLVQDTDYTVTYPSGRKNAGTYKVTITGQGNYTGTVTKSFTIKPVTIIFDMVKLAYSTTTYTGSYKKPAVTVTNGAKTLVQDTDYTVTYASGRKNVGTYEVTISGTGNYTGTVTKTFKINPKPTALTSFTGSAGKLTFKWEKISVQISGYQIQYATKSDFSDAKSIYRQYQSSDSATITKSYSGSDIAKGKYYARVRVYKTVDGVKYYSKWSDAKSVTIG